MLEESADEDLSLAQKFSMLARLTKLETIIKTAIDNSKVPPVETRKLLKSNTPKQVKNTVVFQFMQDLFQEMGLGRMDIVKKKNFTLVISNRDSPVQDLYYDLKGRKTCYIVADALADFFSEDLKVPSEVTEIECENRGDPSCLFRIDLQPLAVYRIAFDDTDEKIIDKVRKGEDSDKICSELSLLEDELNYRIDTLKSFHVLEDDMSLTKIGQTYYKYGKSVIDNKMEDFDPPWKVMSSITSKIADTESFAEAMCSSIGGLTIDEQQIKESEVINLLEEAEQSTSFAQLVSKTFKEDKDKKNDR